MGIEAYPELTDILLGRDAAERERAPEPTLLPHLAPYAGADAMQSLCHFTDVCSGGHSGVPPWPDLRNSVFMPVASRLGDDDDARNLVMEFPALAAFLPDDAVVDACLGAESDPYGRRDTMLVRLAARFPRHGGGALLSAARDVVVNSDGWMRDRLLGWFGVAVAESECRAVLGEMLAGGMPEPEAVAVLLPHLDDVDQDRLLLHLAHGSDAGDPRRAAELMHVLPLAGPQARGALLEVIRPGLLEHEDYWPGWFCSLVTARLNLSGERGLAREFASSRGELESAWKTQLRALADMEFGDYPFRDVLYAHPGATALLTERISLDGLSEPISDLIYQMFDNWGGSGPPHELAPPPEPPRESAPPPAAEPESPPRRTARGGGLLGRVASVGRRMRRAIRRTPTRSIPPQARPRAVPEPEPEAEPEPTAEPRFLQVEILAAENGVMTRREKSFERGAKHQVQVMIAPSGLGRVELDEAFPDELLPRDEASHELTVLLVAADLFDGALSQNIQLPRAGASEVATFELAVPDDAETVALTIIVLHRGAHIQTGYLDGPATAGENDPGAAGFRFRKGQKSAADLDHGEKPQLTFYKDGRQLVIHREGHSDLTPSMAGIDNRLDKIRQALFDGARGVYQLDADLSTGPGLKLLRILAAQGEFMRRKLFGDDTLDEVRRVQVVSPYSADFFPAEYFYDRRAPRADAALCPTFAASTGSGARCDGCSAADDGSIVCPLGFWGLNRVIERQVRPIDLAGDAPPEPRTGGDMLPAVGGVVLAASNHVNDENPNEVTETLAALNTITGARSYLADDWQQWKVLSDEHQPVLLVALPHNVDNDLGFQALQIGADRELALNEIGMDYRPPADSVILLLGCNTAAAAVAYEDFIAGLRGAGAAVVVGTITYVLGMQAAPLAREFVRQFWSQTADQTVPMGEVVRAVRTRMVRGGNPLALAISAFGCADWRLAPGRD